jgi:5'-3' exonuclease
MNGNDKVWEQDSSYFEGAEAQHANYPLAHVLVDADSIAFMNAAVTDGRTYEVDGQQFKYKKDAVGYCDKKSIPVSHIELNYYPEPVEAACLGVDSTISSIKDYYLTTRKLNPRMYFFISGKDNFRYEIFKKYKEKRKKERKPEHREACNQYILKKQRLAFCFDKFEADDLIAMTATALKSSNPGQLISIVSNDKDFTTVGGPGIEQYDYTTGKVWTVSEFEALFYFWKQVIIGDKSDDIPGIHGVAGQTAIKLLSGCVTQSDFYEGAIQAYVNKGNMTEEEAIEHIDIVGQLLHLKRSEVDRWLAPSLKS